IGTTMIDLQVYDYFKHFQNKDIMSLSAMFSETVYLQDWEGAVLIVSHDRYFLNQVTKTIWEMTPFMETYRGNYNAYTEQRTARYLRRLEEYKRQKAFIEKETEYIRRNIAGQNTRQAQGRRKRLERLLNEALLREPSEIGKRQMSMQLDPVGRSGDLVLRTKNLSIGYMDDGKQLLAVPDLLLKRRGRAAVIGPNGAGKTTFLKTILGNLSPLGGEVILGASLKVGYFAQAHEDLHPEWTLMEEIDAVAPHLLPGEVRSYLARFMFTEDDVYKQVKVLSGGERGRLALACLSLQGANLLLLDEPTNHLDLSSQEVLESILGDFPGTILLVSHDRYLIDILASQVWEADAKSKTLYVFDGTYSQYKAARLADDMGEETQQSAHGQFREKKAPQPKDKSGLSNWELRQQKERLLVVETRIVELETKQEKIGYRLEKPPEETAEVERLGNEYQAIQNELDELITEWSEISKVLEEER
ncbi:MAG: ABC-F family ATP-binding cassette domain-containing protein, partial [Anaerolineaceae bacterium]|nr:ABC-F family ATP-binding cassette domain-containing protein [Anaerolineaceae bacterium]